MTGLLFFLALLVLWAVLFLLWRKVNPLRKSRLPRKMSPDQVEDDDPFMRMVVAAAWNTGQTIYATVDDDGNFEMHPVDEPGEPAEPPE